MKVRSPDIIPQDSNATRSLFCVTPHMLQASLKPLSQSMLRQWKKAIGGRFKHAFDATRGAPQGDKGVDAQAITWLFLTRKDFLALKSKSMDQVLVIHILAR